VEVALRRGRLWAAALAMFTLALIWQFLTYNGFPNDHYFHVAPARQMLLGEWPVRDFADAGAPLMFTISAMSRGLFGDVAGSELLVVALGVAVGAAATVLCASWLARSILIGVGVTLLEILVSPRTYSYPKMALYGLAACAIVGIVVNASRSRLLLAAGLTALAFLMRHDHGLFIGVACAAAIVLSASALVDAARRLALFTGVVAALLVPWAVWVQYYKGLISYFETGIAVSRREADISVLRDLPHLELTAGLTTPNAQAWLYWLYWALPVACLALAVWRRITRRERWAGEWTAVVSIAVIALALDASFLRSPLETRLADAIVPACLLGAWLLGLAWTMTGGRAIVIPVRLAASLVLAVTTVVIWRVGDVHDKLDEVGVFEDDLEHLQEHTAFVVQELTRPEMDERKLPSRVSAGLVPFMHYVNRCTTASDRLLVSGPYPDVFVLARRGFAGGHIAFREGFYQSDADQDLTLERMKRQSVPLVVLPLDDQDAFERSFPKIQAHLTAAYDVMTEIAVDGLKGVRILVERARARTGTDSDTGWPCFVQHT
jgi:hypothetical protein